MRPRPSRHMVSFAGRATGAVIALVVVFALATGTAAAAWLAPPRDLFAPAQAGVEYDLPQAVGSADSTAHVVALRSDGPLSSATLVAQDIHPDGTVSQWRALSLPEADPAQEPQAARVAVGPGGHLVAVWVQAGQVMASHRNPGAQWWGEPWAVAPVPEGSRLIDPVLAVAADGTVAMAWIRRAAPPAPFEASLVAARFGVGGQAPLVAITTSAVAQPDASIAFADDRVAIIAWEGHVPGRIDSLPAAFVTRIGPDGTPGETGVVSNPLIAAENVRAVGGGGGVWVTYSQSGSVHAVKVGALPAAPSQAIDIFGSQPGPFQPSAAAPTPDGGLVVVATQPGYGRVHSLHAARLDASGNPVAAWHLGDRVPHPPCNANHLPPLARAVAAADGTISVMWRDQLTDEPDERVGIRTVRVAPDGTVGPVHELIQPGDGRAHFITPGTVAWGDLVAGPGNGVSAIWWHRGTTPQTDHSVRMATFDGLAPHLEITAPTQAQVGQPVTLSAEARDLLSGPPTVEWQLGDGTTATGPGPHAHTYTAPGDYTIQATARDGVGHTTTRSASITVIAAPDVATPDPQAPGTPDPGTPDPGAPATPEPTAPPAPGPSAPSPADPPPTPPAATPPGADSPATAPPTSRPVRPVISALRVRPSSARRGTATTTTSRVVVGLRLNRSARLAVHVQRRAPGLRRGTRCVAPRPALRRAAARPCVRHVTVGRIIRPARAGATTLVITRLRVGRTTLTPGRYRIEARATAPGTRPAVVRRAALRVRMAPAA